MNNDKNNQEFEKLSFWQLLENRSIEIPIIQRDYAQGRANKEKVRNLFLNALKSALIGNPIELDFIYGSEENNVLKPLDGQQRLTTLFLLHWFVANKSGELDVAKKRLLKFTYETRTSSREFCKELIDKNIDFKNLIQLNDEKRITIENQLSETIKDASWFVISWNNDPTISAMLIMLDAIHEKFNDSTDLWQKLIETEEDIRPITFLYIKLENFGLSDDLYIKMNARGKALTPFENFKSRFGRHIENSGWEKELNNPKEAFIHKIDTVWTDLFWDYREKNEKKDEDGNLIFEYKIDDKLINFITGVTLNYYAQSLEIQSNKEEEEKVRKELQDKGKHITDSALKRERIERRMVVLFNNPNEIVIDDFMTKEAFEYLEKCLNVYTQNNFAELKSDVELWKYCINTLFEDIIHNEKSEWQNRVVFYAQTTYLLNNSFDKNTFNDWIRVARNIVENSTIDSAATFISAINLIQELSIGCSDIYNYLSNNTTKARHAEEQVKEETRKAKLIVNDIDVKEIIFELEDTSFCKGSINWCLECSDKVEELKKIKNIIDSHLSENDVSNLFRRALLTIGNNDFYNYWGTWSFSTNTQKRCLIESRFEVKNSFTKNWLFNNNLKLLIIQLCKNDNDLQSIIDNYTCSNSMPNWKVRLIKEPNLLDNYCQGHYLGITNDDKQCYLYNWKKRPASRDECYLVE